MTDYEMVSEIVSKTGASFSDAKKAFDESGKDILSAIIMLENEKKTDSYDFSKTEEYIKTRGKKFSRAAARGLKKGADCAENVLTRMCRNKLVVSGEKEIFSVPALAAVIIGLCTGIMPMLVAMLVSLFLGISYRLTGPDIAKDMVIGVTRCDPAEKRTVINAEYSYKNEVADNGFFTK